MTSISHWKSPDGTINKSLLCIGDSKYKPTEGTKCKLQISNGSEDLNHFRELVIGDVDGDLGRQIEICVSTMFENEKSTFVVKLEDRVVTFTLELLEMQFGGFLYEWDAKKKYDYSQFQNEKGKKYFKEENIREAGFRFNKGLKIILSIPIDIQEPPESIDDIPIHKIDQMKATLYNNLATCFFKKEKWNLVIRFCDKVFLYDKDNLKASYRAAVSYIEDRNFERADELLQKVLQKEPNNKSALGKHQFVKKKLREAEKQSDKIAKKMIGDILSSN